MVTGSGGRFVPRPSRTRGLLCPRANTWAERAAQAFNSNNFDQAEEAFHRAIALNPWDGRFNAYLAKVCAVKYKILTKANTRKPGYT